MRQWILNVYRSFFQNEIKKSLKLRVQGEGWIKKKLGETLRLAAKQNLFYKSYKQLPLSLWPTVDKNMLSEHQLYFQDLFPNIQEVPANHSSMLSKSELNLFQQLQRNPKEIYFDRILGFYCAHGNLCFPKALYWIEKAWIDEKHFRFVPIVTTLTRKKSMLVRFRLNQIFKVVSSSCVCDTHSVVVSASVSQVEDVLYLPHLFEKRLLPIFIDELAQFFATFDFFQINKIVQKSLLNWEIHVVNLTAEPTAYQADLYSQLQKFLIASHVKCPQIQWIESTTPFTTTYLQVEKAYNDLV